MAKVIQDSNWFKHRCSAVVSRTQPYSMLVALVLFCAAISRVRTCCWQIMNLKINHTAESHLKPEWLENLARTHFRTFLSVPRSCIVRRLLSPVVTDLLTSKAEIENVSAPTKPKQFFCSSRKKSFHFSFFKWSNNKGSNRWFFKRAWMDEIWLKGKN